MFVGFGVDRCLFLWSLANDVLWVSNDSWVLVWIGVGVWIIYRSAEEVWILVWIGCGSVVEVCDFGLDRLWVDNGGL